MKAFIYHKYGSPDVLKCEEIEKPKPGDDEVLMKVRAAALNPLDWHFMRGTPYFIRLLTGLVRPKTGRLGVDVAGTVENLGRNVKVLKPGDEVFGSCRGAFAEYVCTLESALVRKPENLTFEQAASVPIAAVTALQGLRDKGKIQQGQTVLINGAAGGVGTFAVQIAKSFGAHVTGVCSTRNVDMVKSIGADRVIDYTQEDFTKSGQRYDIILDCIGNHSILSCRRCLHAAGIYIPVGGTTGRWMIGSIFESIAAAVVSKFVSQKLVGFFMARLNNSDLSVLCELMRSGKIEPIIDKRYTLSDVPEAIRYVEKGHARGKVVIAIS